MVIEYDHLYMYTLTFGLCYHRKVTCPSRALPPVSPTAHFVLVTH